MKRILIVCAALLLCGMAAARGRGVHRVVSCNIRVALPQDEEGGNGWSVRKYVCERVMKRCKADIYCLQEVTVGQYEDMCRMFPGYFVFGYPGPETDALPDREYHGIAKNLVMFSKRRYEMTGAGVYWLSVLSLHLDHISHEARLAQVRAVEEETSQYPAGVPQVLAGDFNSRPSNPVAGVLVGAGWVDAFVEANGEDAEHMSFHRFEGDAYKPKKGTPGRIDYIFLKGTGIRVVSSAFVKDCVGGKYPSDHYFLTADIVIE